MEQSARLRFTTHVYDPHALGGVHEEFASKFFIAGECHHTPSVQAGWSTTAARGIACVTALQAR
jgi:hypothetical protein